MALCFFPSLPLGDTSRRQNVEFLSGNLVSLKSGKTMTKAKVFIWDALHFTYCPGSYTLNDNCREIRKKKKNGAPFMKIWGEKAISNLHKFTKALRE